MSSRDVADVKEIVQRADLACSAMTVRCFSVRNVNNNGQEVTIVYVLSSYKL